MGWFGLTSDKSKEKEKQRRKRAQAEADQLRAQLSQNQKGYGNQEEEISRLARELDERDKQLGEQGWKEGEELFSRDVRGMTPEQRRRIEENSSMRLNRSLQGASRDVLASQGQKGLRGPAAYAQQRDVQNLGRTAQQDFYRDLEEYDPELALKKMAMMFNVQQGRRATGHLNRQQAIDELRLKEERGKQRELQDYFSRQFNRI